MILSACEFPILGSYPTKQDINSILCHPATRVPVTFSSLFLFLFLFLYIFRPSSLMLTTPYHTTTTTTTTTHRSRQEARKALVKFDNDIGKAGQYLLALYIERLVAGHTKLECSYCSSMSAVDMLIRPTEVYENDCEDMGEGKGYDDDGGGGGAVVHAATTPCAHVLCLVCATKYVRQAMGNRADQRVWCPGGVRCPGGRDCRSMVTVGAVGRLVGRSEDPSCRLKLEHHDGGPVQPLTRQDQAKFGRMVQAALIPALQRRYCVNAACVDADGARNVTDIGAEAPPEFECAFCQTRMCALALPGGLPCGRESHRSAKGIWSCEGAKAAEAREAKEEAEEKGLVHAGADLLTTAAIAATTKPCPKCGAGVSHYHGHSCHHISPSGGCPSCGQHFCYSCLGLGKHCRSCRIYCSSNDIVANLKTGAVWPVDKRCGCPICPDCRPGRKPCVHCHGDCVVCMGVVPPGALNEEAVRRKAGAGSGGGRGGGAEGKAGGGGEWDDAEDRARQAILGVVVSAKGHRGNRRFGCVTDYAPLRSLLGASANENQGKHEVTFRKRGGGSVTQWLDLSCSVDWTERVIQDLDQADEDQRIQVAMAASRLDASRAEANRVRQVEIDRVQAEVDLQAEMDRARAETERYARYKNYAIAGAGGAGLVAFAGPAALLGAGAAAIGGAVTVASAAASATVAVAGGAAAVGGAALSATATVAGAGAAVAGGVASVGGVGGTVLATGTSVVSTIGVGNTIKVAKAAAWLLL